MANLRYLVPMPKFSLYNTAEGAEGSDNFRITVNGQNMLNMVVFFNSREKEMIYASFYTTSLAQITERFIEDLAKDDKEIKHAITQSSSWEGVDQRSSLILGRSKNGVCYVKLIKNGNASPAFKFTKYKGKDLVLNGDPILDVEASASLMRAYLSSLIRTTESIAAAIAMKDAIEKPNDRNFGGNDGGGSGDGASKPSGGNKNLEDFEDDIPF